MNRETYINRIKEQLDELNASLNRWEEKGREVSGQLQEDLDQRIENLRELREGLSADLDRLRIAGEDSWSEVQETAARSMGEVADIARDAISRFRELLLQNKKG